MISRNRAYAITEILLVFFVITLTFLPAMRQATIYRDDWYYTMDRLIGGPQAFHEMFVIDRPARGYLFETYYRLFGVEPAPYHLAAFFWRLIAGLGGLWLFRLLWPKQRAAALMMAILFIIYPGYTRWLEGFEDQPKIVSLFLEVTSIAMSLQAIKTSRAAPKILLWVGSIVTGWGYLALIDYAIGMEIFRYLCIFLVCSREHEGENLLRKGLHTMRTGLPALLIAGVFLFWRIFLFENLRPETDISLQLGALVESPLHQGMWWLIHLSQSVLNEAVFAWTAPFIQGLFGLRARGILTGLLTAAVAGSAILAASYLYRNTREETGTASPGIWQLEAIWLGLTGVVFGVLPVIMANRAAEFGAFSHYMVPASLASAVFIVGLVSSLTWPRARYGAVTALVFLAVASQYAAAAGILDEEEKISSFWHQVAWRAPGIRSGTTLAVMYPGVNFGEDVDAINGPANFLYFPETTNQLPVEYRLYGLKQSAWTSKDVIGGGESSAGYRTHYGKINYEHLLVMSQPAEGACVHIIDRRWPWYSPNDDDAILIMGQYSRIETIMTGANPPKLKESIFGPEPSGEWCYYFQKAGLALQNEDWSQVRDLGEEALQQKLHPQDVTEWIPFLQAYAVLGDEENIKIAASKIKESAFHKAQACNVLRKMHEQEYSFTPAVEAQVEELFCTINH